MSYMGVLLLLSLLIVVHEVGHLAAAKLTGIPVTSFSVGLGPKLWTRRWRRVEYSVRLLPLGGFVVPDTDEFEFAAIPLRKRVFFFLGGPLANLVAALPLFAILNAARGGASVYNLLIAPFEQVAVACWQLLMLLPNLFSQPELLSGVIGIVAEGGRAVESGMLLGVAISLSISLAVLNLLPIPVLDGGQIVLSCLERMFPRFTRLRVPLTVLGMALLAAVMIYANGRDVVSYWLA